MTTGRNEFPVYLEAADIAEITDMRDQSLDPKAVAAMIESGMPLEDIHTVEILIAVKRFLEDRHCYSGFEVMLED